MKTIASVGVIESQIQLKRKPLRSYVSITVSGTFVYENRPYVQGLEYKQNGYITVYYPRQVMIYGINTF